MGNIEELKKASENLGTITAGWSHGSHYGQHSDLECSYCKEYMYAVARVVSEGARVLSDRLKENLARSRQT